MDEFDLKSLERKNMKIVALLHEALTALPLRFPALFDQGIRVKGYSDGKIDYWRIVCDDPDDRFRCMDVCCYRGNEFDRHDMPAFVPEYDKGLAAVRIEGDALYYGGRAKLEAVAALLTHQVGLNACVAEYGKENFLFVDFCDPDVEAKIGAFSGLSKASRFGPKAREAYDAALLAETKDYACKVVRDCALDERMAQLAGSLDRVLKDADRIGGPVAEEIRKLVDEKMESHRAGIDGALLRRDRVEPSLK